MDVSNEQSAIEGVSNAESQMKQHIDYVFLCAGYSNPQLISSLTGDDFASLMHTNYLGNVYTVLEVMKRMKSRKEAQKIVFCGSVLSLVNKTFIIHR